MQCHRHLLHISHGMACMACLSIFSLACLQHQLTHFLWFPKASKIERKNSLIFPFFVVTCATSTDRPAGNAIAKLFHIAIEIFYSFRFWEFFDFAKIFCLVCLLFFYWLPATAMSWIALFGQLRFLLILGVWFYSIQDRFYKDPLPLKRCAVSSNIFLLCLIFWLYWKRKVMIKRRPFFCENYVVMRLQKMTCNDNDEKPFKILFLIDIFS